MRFLNIGIFVSVLTLLASCAQDPKKEFFSTSLPDMTEFMTRNKAPVNQYGDGQGELGFARDQRNELDVLFKEIPTKRLSIYVFPHLRNGYPVPGYTTSATLFDSSQLYLLPGERVEP